MIYLDAHCSRQLPPEELPAAVRAALGKPLRRAAALTQLAVLGALACIPAERRQQPTALLWQSTGGPRQETLKLLDEVCNGTAEPLPYDFLASQPTIAAAQLRAFLPGLRSASYLPLDDTGSAHWSLLLALAHDWLHEGRYAQVLCAHLDCGSDLASAHGVLLGTAAQGNPPASLRLTMPAAPETRAGRAADTPDFPAHLAAWLARGDSRALALESPAAPRLALEFARL